MSRYCIVRLPRDPATNPPLAEIFVSTAPPRTVDPVVGAAPPLLNVGVVPMRAKADGRSQPRQHIEGPIGVAILNSDHRVFWVLEGHLAERFLMLPEVSDECNPQ